MSAPSIAALLDYETNIEDALKAYLEAAITGTQILTTRSILTEDPELTTPRVTLNLQISGTNPNQQANRSTDAGEYDSHKLGTLTLVASMRRNATGQSMTALRGGIRKAMLKPTAAFDGTNLPYYQIVTLREGSCTTGVSADNDEISYTISYGIEFFIKPDQWAAS